VGLFFSSPGSHAKEVNTTLQLEHGPSTITRQGATFTLSRPQHPATPGCAASILRTLDRDHRGWDAETGVRRSLIAWMKNAAPQESS